MPETTTAPSIDPVVDELTEAWPGLSVEERVDRFRNLPRAVAGTFFLSRSARAQAQLVFAAPEWEKRLLMRMLAPDDAADVLQELPAEERASFMQLLDDKTRVDVTALLAYNEDDAGGLMNPRFVRVRPEMTCDEAISYVRRETRDRAEIIQYLYVLDQDQRLQGVLSFRDLFAAVPTQKVTDVMRRNSVTVREDTDQEEVARIIAKNDLVAVPVLSKDGRMIGIVTVDDIVDVVQAEATEDIQRIGGSGALDKPYLQTRFGEMLKKRAPWLAILFVGELLTASAMGFFEDELHVALILFLPLIISTGGNAGSQATTLVIRAIALNEVRMRDWWRVMRRELLVGLAMGAILGALGLLRVFLGPRLDLQGYESFDTLPLSITVAIAVTAIVVWGAVIGSILPIVLKKAKLDPATASAPFVATLVDVTGIVIYFTVAKLVLRGALG